MRILPLHGDELDPYRIATIMTHPTSPEWQCYELNCRLELATLEGKIVLPLHLEQAIRKSVLDAPSLEAVNKKANEEASKAHLAGMILLAMLTDSETPSLARAFHMLSYQNEDSTFNGIYMRELKRDDRKRLWQPYRPTAPLWAAAHCITHDQGLAPSDSLRSVLKNLPVFIAVSEKIRIMAETLTPPSGTRHNQPYLPKHDCWRPPSDYPLPAVECTGAIVPDWVCGWMEKHDYTEFYQP